MKKIEQVGEQKKTTRGKEKVVRNRRPRETAPGQKRGDENELERNLRLENVVTSKQLRLAVLTEEDRRAKLENNAATKWLRLAMETDEERKARLEKMVETTQLRLALETEEERRAKKEWI